GLARPDLVADGRKQLIGLLTTNPKVVLEEGAQVTKLANPPAGTPAEGHVTSSYYSPAMGRSIALAMVKDGRNLIGTKLNVPMPDGAIEVEVTETVFVDKEGGRVNG
ncbi:glycine cleavage T C-terminal barrel domain-containing protein, partial [Roseibium sp. TrichSKD4]|uniref:glycine cleavage T C-terminal barrel domain-containing protein n=1 Tax=Roseibium sp. TrichSKD4 TaxID=744980 RepID=UPI0005917462